MMDWKENEKGNWTVTTPSGTMLVVYKRDQEWSWMAQRKYEDHKTWSEERYKDAGEAKAYLDERSAVKENAVIPEAPPDYFNIDVDSVWTI